MLGKTTVYYDGNCSFCIKAKNILGRLDHLRKFNFISFRGLKESDLPVSPETHERSMVVIDKSGKVSLGMTGVSRLFRKIPELFIAGIVISGLVQIGIGEKIYDRISKSRYSILVGKCNETCELNRP